MLKLNMQDVLASGSGTNVDGHSHRERRLLPQSSTQKNYFPDTVQVMVTMGNALLSSHLPKRLANLSLRIDHACLMISIILYACLSLIV